MSDPAQELLRLIALGEEKAGLEARLGHSYLGAAAYAALRVMVKQADQVLHDTHYDNDGGYTYHDVCCPGCDAQEALARALEALKAGEA